MRGPVPKRSEERIRRNIPVVPVDRLISTAPAPEIPPLGIEDIHPLAEDWYMSLASSAQTQYFEASDWQAARICAFSLDKYLKSARPSPEMYKAIQIQFAELMVTEGARRKMRLEIVRTQAKEDAAVVSAADAVMAQYAAMFAAEERAEVS